ncbi:MAG: 50S ribosomal protein L11 methyltransferase [Candidatus Promineifilaceae bacterium]
MATLNPTKHLQRVPKLAIQLKANNSVQLKWGRKHLSAGIHTLAILNAFRQPKTFADGLKQVVQTEQGNEEALSSTISQLFDAGVLRNVDVAKKVETSSTIAFDTPMIHIEMLNDRTRTAQYLKAIREVVREGDVVVDLGTGTGVLALAAAQAGASHVYAIEINARIARAAKANFARNGFADKISLHLGRSTGIVLPERADVLISEIIGNDPFDEQIIEMTTDARLRFLKPNARMIPNRIEVYGLPVTIPSVEYAKHIFSSQSADDWHSWYDIDFSALTEMHPIDYEPLFNITPQMTKTWPRLHAPLRFANVDLHQYRDQHVSHQETVQAQADGRLNGLLIYFEVELSKHISLSTHPDKAGVENHWRSPVWGIFPAVDVKVGDLFTVQYEADSQRNWTYASVFKPVLESV